MTSQEIAEYLQQLAVSSGMVDNGSLLSLAQKCVSMGLKDFWGASEWTFRTYEYNLSITSSTDDYEMPADFMGFTTVKEKDSLRGRELTYLPKAEFDKLMPHPTSFPATYPQMFTAWFDNSASKQKWYMRFYPMPSSGHTIVIEVVTKAPSDASVVPEDYIGGVVANAQKYLYPLGKSERLNAWAEAREEVKRLEIIDSPFRGRPFMVFDDTDNQTGTVRWYQL